MAFFGFGFWTPLIKEVEDVQQRGLRGRDEHEQGAEAGLRHAAQEAALRQQLARRHPHTARGQHREEVQLDSTPEIEVFFMLFERRATKDRKRSIKQNINTL